MKSIRRRVVVLTLSSFLLIPPPFSLADQTSEPTENQIQTEALAEAAALSAALKSDFLVGKITTRAEAAHQTLDAKTSGDLELEELLELLTAYAPSEMAKERIAWLIGHPYLDRDEVVRRQQAVMTIAANDELFARLADLFESDAPGNPIVEKLFPRPQAVSRRTFVDELAGSKIASGSTLASLINIGFIAILEQSFGSRLYQLATEPNLWSGLGLPFDLLFLAVMSAQDKSSPPILAASATARRSRAFARESDDLFAAEHLQAIRTVCQTNDDCMKKLGRLSWLASLRGRVGVLSRILAVTNVGSFPAALYVRHRRDVVLRATAALTELETYYAFAKFYRLHKEQLVFPEILASSHIAFSVVEGHHPYLWMSGKPCVANSVEFDAAQGARTYIITGPNAGGKTTFQQMNLSLAVMAMIGLPVPAKSMKLNPFYIFTNFTTNNGKLADAKSTFASQAARVVEMVNFVRDHRPSFVAMDEILTGTSTPEHQAFERATLRVLHETSGVLSTLSTHDRSLVTFADEMAGAANLRVSLEGHRLLPGPSQDFNAFDVMAAAGAPPELLEYSRHYFDQFDAGGKKGCEKAMTSEGEGAANPEIEEK